MHANVRGLFIATRGKRVPGGDWYASAISKLKFSNTNLKDAFDILRDRTMRHIIQYSKSTEGDGGVWVGWGSGWGSGSGWGGGRGIRPISSNPLFHRFSPLSKHWFTIKKHVGIWQVTLQLSCNDTSLIYKSSWKELTRTFAKPVFTEKSTNGDLITLTPGCLWHGI